MVMNFGPINQEGGEKRLNVIFSRARVHMAIVSSIDASAITNTYNDGANTLRRFLDYAAALSRGDPNGATAVITSLRERRSSDLPAVRRSAVASQLGEALRARGLVVVERVGRSGFRVDLAVRRPEDDEHRVAVLIDGADRIASQPVPERVLGHPGVLRATGWRVVHVLTRDWLERSEAVIEAVERAIATDGDRDAAAATEVRDELERATAALATSGVEAAAPIVDPGVTLLPLAGPTAAVVAGAGLGGVAGSTGPAVAGDPGARPPVLRGRSVCFTGSSVCCHRRRPAVAGRPGASRAGGGHGRPPVGDLAPRLPGRVPRGLAVDEGAARRAARRAPHRRARVLAAPRSRRRSLGAGCPADAARATVSDPDATAPGRRPTRRGHPLGDRGPRTRPPAGLRRWRCGRCPRRRRMGRDVPAPGVPLVRARGRTPDGQCQDGHADPDDHPPAGRRPACGLRQPHPSPLAGDPARRRPLGDAHPEVRRDHGGP